MLRLIVLRHAKSDWDAGAQTDHERPLNSRGVREAPLTAAHLAERGFVPSYISSSDARRTTETLELMTPFAAVPRVFDRRLYLADLDVVRAFAPELPPNVACWMIVGHNPGWEDLVRELTRVGVEMKTANAAVLRADVATFAELLSGSASVALEAMITPGDE